MSQLLGNGVYLGTVWMLTTGYRFSLIWAHNLLMRWPASAQRRSACGRRKSLTTGLEHGA
ncbi:hypothetical protein BDZ89DRAFT_313580 [Hymenopellis radicata]|nr:hypothetical protein BDZ89DRAFT_313580 [Hymenopellis radicata]